ncbi:MAG: DUF4416 domain-containing protein [Spirochaetes bacterium]|nr:MAG: DUF4416 domain-containing protein [Spirochaetota bacterium]
MGQYIMRLKDILSGEKDKMGKISFPDRAILFCGILYNKNFDLKKVEEILARYFGKIIFSSSKFEFTETDYYNEEMGEPIFRIFYAIDKLIEQDKIIELKLLSNKLEDEYFTINSKRKVNIDPGYVTKAKVVLPTTKNFQHRIYMGKGIFAEVTLRWRKGSFTEWEWTFKDYRRKESIEFFNKLREYYSNLKSSGKI